MLLKHLPDIFGNCENTDKKKKATLKLSQNKKDPYDVTAAPFLVFFAAGSWEKDTENGAAMTSLTLSIPNQSGQVTII